MNSRKIGIVFGALLRELRKKKSFSQEKLAFESGIDRGYISMLELGHQIPSLKTMLTLSYALNIPFGHLASLFAERLKEASDE